MAIWGLRREPWDTPRSSKLAFWMRAGLLALAVPQGIVGAWAMFAPGSFHVDFPLPGWRWISTLGHYNAHLSTDYGAASLGLVAVLFTAALSLERRLVRVALGAWLVWALPHMAYHLSTLERFGPIDKIANVATLTVNAVLPIMLLGMTRGGRWQ